MMQAKVLVLSITCGAALLSLCTPAKATTFVLMDEGALAAESTAVVNGWVTGVESAADAETGGVNTYVTIEPSRVIAGALPEGEIVLREPGGHVEGRTEKIFGAPEYAIGEHVMVFLSRHPDGSLYTTAMAMGKYTIGSDSRGGTAVTRTLGDEVMLLDLSLRRLVRPAAPQRTALSTFIDRVRAASRHRLRDPHAPTVRLTPPELGVSVPHRYESPFTYLGTPSRWFEPDSGAVVRFLIDPTGDAGVGPAASRAAVDSALAAWNAVPTSNLLLGDGGLLSAPQSFSGCGGDNRIVFNDPFDEITDPSGCGGILALGGFCSSDETTTVNGTTFKRIVRGKVIFNNGWDRCDRWDQCNLAEVATHEIGHAIGFGHSADSDATMAAVAHFDGRCAGLAADDVAGATFVYPQGGAVPPTSTPVPQPSATSTPRPPTPTATPTTASGVGNDSCSAATVIDTASYASISQTAAATLHPSDPIPPCGNGSRGKSVWYRFTAPSSGSLTVTTYGSNYDTLLAAFTGSCGDFTPVPSGCNDDSGGRQSRLFLQVTGGTTYYFLVTAYANDGGTLAFQLAFLGSASTATPTRTPTPRPPTPTNTQGAAPTATATAAPSTPTATPRPPAAASPTATRIADQGNDSSANAVEVDAIPFHDVRQTSAAGSDPLDPGPSCGNRSRGRAAWYRFTAPSDGVVTATTFGSSYDTILTTFVELDGTMREVPGGCNDDAGSLQSRVSVSTNAGETYYFLATAYSNNGGTLVFELTFQGTGNTATPTRTFTPRPPTPTNTQGAPPTASPTSAPAAPTATSRPPTPTFTPSNAPVATPAGEGSNSSSANPREVVTLPYVDVQQTSGAVPDLSDPAPWCGNRSRANSAWYRFTAPSDGAMVADTSGSSYDTILAAFSSGASGMVPLGCNDDSGSLQSRLSLTATGGATYYFLVTAYSGNGRTLVFHLSFQGTGAPAAPTPTFTPRPPTPTFTQEPPPTATFTPASQPPDSTATPTLTPSWQPPPPTATPATAQANDHCDSAVVVSAIPYLDTTSTAGAAADLAAPAPPCGNRSRSNSAWYRFTAPSSGRLTASTYGSSYDTILAVFSGACGDLTPVPGLCNDDAGTLQSRVSFETTAGGTYYFLVTAYRSDGGRLVFQVTN